MPVGNVDKRALHHACIADFAGPRGQCIRRGVARLVRTARGSRELSRFGSNRMFRLVDEFVSIGGEWDRPYQNRGRVACARRQRALASLVQRGAFTAYNMLPRASGTQAFAGCFEDKLQWVFPPGCDHALTSLRVIINTCEGSGVLLRAACHARR